MKYFLTYLKSKRGGIVLYFSSAAVLLVSFALFRLPLRAVAYPLGLTAMLALAAFAWDYHRTRKLHGELAQLEHMTAELFSALPEPQTVPEEDYQAILQNLQSQCTEMAEKHAAEQEKALDYYTLWVHQIKTPIAAMRLRLQGEDSSLARSLLADLGRIEQYVEMVLTYLRLEGNDTDYVFRKTALDTVIRTSLRKYSGEFIMRKLTLHYEPTGLSVLTDEKWLAFVFEQVLSNALKYTPSGGIYIYAEAPQTLCIRDTGIGIAPEDLPRIFERSYTGLQGRSDHRASGIGLYLCRRISKNLGHTITAESVPGEGTTIRIRFSESALQVE